MKRCFDSIKVILSRSILCRIVFCLADSCLVFILGCCIHRLLNITVSAAATKITRPRRKFAPIVLVLVFEFVLLLLQERCVVIVMYHFNRGSVFFIPM